MAAVIDTSCHQRRAGVLEFLIAMLDVDRSVVLHLLEK
jgi:hypothetical protein